MAEGHKEGPLSAAGKGRAGAQGGLWGELCSNPLSPDRGSQLAGECSASQGNSDPEKRAQAAKEGEPTDSNSQLSNFWLSWAGFGHETKVTGLTLV